MSYTDIHSHIIFGVDDGSESLEESMRMLRQAYEENIRTIIATPHFGLSNPNYKRETAENNLKKLCESIEYPDVKILMGNELLWSNGIINSLKNGEAYTLGETKYVLVEFITDTAYEEIENAVSEFVWNGYYPIIAHTERYDSLKYQPYKVEELIRCGAYIQVNCRSISMVKKRFGFRRKNEWCEEMLERNLVHFLASDCHDCEIRKPIFESVIEEAKKISNEDIVKNITFDNTRKLIENTKI